jgi:hypothetical protein
MYSKIAIGFNIEITFHELGVDFSKGWRASTGGNHIL